MWNLAKFLRLTSKFINNLTEGIMFADKGEDNPKVSL